MSRRRALSFLLLITVASFAPTLQAGHSGPGTHFGPGNVPAGCSGTGPSFRDGCYHMLVGLNTGSIQTPVIDVLLVPPVSPYPERDLRQMRQAIHMWEAGIDQLAPQMGLDWLGEAMEFNVFVDDDEFTTHPAWDPEIVVVVTNAIGGVGIGTGLGYGYPCKGPNPLADFEAWEQLPGFDSHHDGHGGTYVDECEGGGKICYAVTAATDPAGDSYPVFGRFGVFRVTAHEVGHCLSIGHVGDALGWEAATVPRYDIMAYAKPTEAKCVSTLDVEGIAIHMSGLVLEQTLRPNSGDYQTQHPKDHHYASPTGDPRDCPKPDLGL